MTTEKLTARVFNIQRFCVHDGPGIRTTVFLAGCNLRCKWCQNPEGLREGPELMVNLKNCIHCGACLKVCPNGAISVGSDGQIETDRNKCTVCGKCTEVCYSEAREMVGRDYTVDELLENVLKDRVAFLETGGGVTLSGGEPTMNAEFVTEFLKKCKDNGIHTVIETNGSAKWETLVQIAEFTDMFLFDIKLFRPDRHKYWTGMSNERILSNFKGLIELDKKVIPRVALIPGVNDDSEEFGKILNLIRTSLPQLKKLHILPFHQLGASKYRDLGIEYEMADTDTENENLQKCVEAAKATGLKVDLGGADSSQEEIRNTATEHVLYKY